MNACDWELVSVCWYDKILNLIIYLEARGSVVKRLCIDRK